LSGRKTGVLLLLVLPTILSCAVEPSEEVVRSTIRHYFQGRNYNVLELQLGSISPIPLDERTYMGTQGHVVEIAHIALEVREDAREYKKGERLVFTNAVIRIREQVGKKGDWIIADISGIYVP